MNMSGGDIWHNGFEMLVDDEVDFDIFHHASSGIGTNELSVGVRVGNSTKFYNWYTTQRNERLASGTLLISDNNSHWGMHVGRNTATTVSGNYTVWEPSR